MTGQNPVFIPGPTNIPERLRHAMGIQTKDHRLPDFGELLAPLLIDLKRIFKTAVGQVFTFTASGIPSSPARARRRPRNTTVGQRGPRCAAPPEGGYRDGCRGHAGCGVR